MTKMITPIPDEMILILYKQILVPWETVLKSHNGKWDAEPLRTFAESCGLVIESIEQEHLAPRVKHIRGAGPTDFLVFVRGKSLGCDLFRHVRNAVAHAGISILAKPQKPTTLLFQSPASRKPGLAFIGQLGPERLSTLIEALAASAPASSL